MKTAEERINALSAIVPNEVIAFLKAHLCARNASEEIFKNYKAVYDSNIDVQSCDIYQLDGGSKLNDFEDTIWHRASVALENWIYENYYGKQ